jgi:hypothetical protein
MKLESQVLLGICRAWDSLRAIASPQYWLHRTLSEVARFDLDAFCRLPWNDTRPKGEIRNEDIPR